MVCGAGRIVLAFTSYAYALTDWRVTLFCYMFSQLLDAADGLAARAFNQSSQFGAVLDMVTDRTSTACLCVILAHLYPAYIAGFCALITLDLLSHWYHMYVSLVMGQTSHKASKNIFISMYYRKPVLFVVCAATETWYISTYCLYHGEYYVGSVPFWRSVFWCCTPFFVYKQAMNVLQLCEACETLVEADLKAKRQ